MDNNVAASANYKNIIAEIVDLGFVPGAKLKRKGKPPVQRRVDFNQGVDARILCKDKMYLREMSRICLKPLRIAFDHIGVRKPYETAIRYAHEFGLHDLSNYMLYNFHDSPDDLYERMALNISLNEQLGVRIFSFPMRYQPTDMKDRSHIGSNWNRYFLRSMQIILQATHGIVSGSPDFFRRAFGSNEREFKALLMRPEKFLFNRVWFEELDGKAEFAEFLHEFQTLNSPDQVELMKLLSSSTPSQFTSLAARTENAQVKRALRWYAPLTDEQEKYIWAESKRARKFSVSIQPTIPEDELVEDAGLLEVA
jgi:hypothetical protein